MGEFGLRPVLVLRKAGEARLHLHFVPYIAVVEFEASNGLAPAHFAPKVDLNN
jgi:hypothetical protein